MKHHHFCVVCGEYIPQTKFTFSDSLIVKYNKIYNVSISLDNSYSPKSICHKCRNNLYGINKKVFSRPMIWRPPTDHTTDCYFGLTNLKGYNRKDKDFISYARVTSVTLPVLIDTDSDHIMEINESEQEMVIDEDMPDETVQLEERENFSTSESDDEENISEAKSFNKNELSDLCRDLGLSKDRSEL